MVVIIQEYSGCHIRDTMWYHTKVCSYHTWNIVVIIRDKQWLSYEGYNGHHEGHIVLIIQWLLCRYHTRNTVVIIRGTWWLS